MKSKTYQRQRKDVWIFGQIANKDGAYFDTFPREGWRTFWHISSWKIGTSSYLVVNTTAAHILATQCGKTSSIRPTIPQYFSFTGNVCCIYILDLTFIILRNHKWTHWLWYQSGARTYSCRQLTTLLTLMDVPYIIEIKVKIVLSFPAILHGSVDFNYCICYQILGRNTS